MHGIKGHIEKEWFRFLAPYEIDGAIGKGISEIREFLNNPSPVFIDLKDRVNLGCGIVVRVFSAQESEEFIEPALVRPKPALHPQVPLADKRSVIAFRSQAISNSHFLQGQS